MMPVYYWANLSSQAVLSGLKDRYIGISPPASQSLLTLTLSFSFPSPYLLQLTVYNYKGGPCYRCLYPSPPPPHTVTNCSDGGVIGAGTYALLSLPLSITQHLFTSATVPGMIGTLQALEVMKIAANIGGKSLVSLVD